MNASDSSRPSEISLLDKVSRIQCQHFCSSTIFDRLDRHLESCVDINLPVQSLKICDPQPCIIRKGLKASLNYIKRSVILERQ